MKALALLKKKNNEIEIFVEDTGNFRMWVTILRAIVPPHVRFRSPNMLNGRGQVVKACRLDQADDARKRIYIIGGDFDFLLGKSKPRLKYLYRLRGYCVENLIINKNVCERFVQPWCPTKTDLEVSALIDFDTWINDLVKTLTPLFVVYATAYKIEPSIKTIGHNINNFYTAGAQGPVVDRMKVNSQIRHVSRQIVKKKGIIQFRKLKQTIVERLSNLDVTQILSGKDYILPVLYLRLRALTGVGLNHEQFKASLSQYWHEGCEPYLCRSIRSVCDV